MLTARALIVAGIVLAGAGCGSDGESDAGGQPRALAPARADVTIAKLEPADPLPALRAERRKARSREGSGAGTQSAQPSPESTQPPPQSPQPPPQSPKKSPPKQPESQPDSGGEEQLLE